MLRCWPSGACGRVRTERALRVHCSSYDDARASNLQSITAQTA
jgi:hypothetical protein